MTAQIVVEVPAKGRKANRLDPGARRSGHKHVPRAVSGRIAVRQDIEPPQRRRELDGSEVRRRECRDHRHEGQSRARGQYGFDSLSGRHHLGSGREAHAIAEKIAHRAAGIVDIRFVRAVRVEPGPMRARGSSVKIGHGGDHRWYGQGWAVIGGTIVAARMEMQGLGVCESGDAATAQIDFGERAPKGLRDGEQTSCGAPGIGWAGSWQ